MKFFRTHITQSFNIGLLLVGLVFYFIKPVSNHSEHDAFAVWLQSNLKSNTNDNVADQIRGLSTANVELESVIREASALVKAYADDFELPVDKQSQDENEVFQVLLKEWKDYQNSSTGMGKAVIIKQAQSHSVLPVDGLAFGGKSPVQQYDISPSVLNTAFEQITLPSFNYYISPLSGGMAINAP
ncbi:MAG: hypothetical protein HUJ22_08290 [Gracilimonas sp.]|uniref:hypothetical protein n=1 Tax=Gracilimonas sp. TaxID=1974203 RepID=UPI00199DA0ED|nr:hypothetical protein [Gracilimonas sp.]MBD3616558.1 hypothetical protein [Gracilimonas sp.]